MLAIWFFLKKRKQTAQVHLKSTGVWLFLADASNQTSFPTGVSLKEHTTTQFYRLSMSQPGYVTLQPRARTSVLKKTDTSQLQLIALHLLCTSVGTGPLASCDVQKFFSFKTVKSEQISYLRCVLLLAADILPKHWAHPVYKRPF